MTSNIVTLAVVDTVSRFRTCPPLRVAQFLFQESYSESLLDDSTRWLILMAGVEALVGPAVGLLHQVAWHDSEIADLLAKLRSSRNRLAHGGSLRLIVGVGRRFGGFSAAPDLRSKPRRVCRARPFRRSGASDTRRHDVTSTRCIKAGAYVAKH